MQRTERIEFDGSDGHGLVDSPIVLFPGVSAVVRRLTWRLEAPLVHHNGERGALEVVGLEESRRFERTLEVIDFAAVGAPLPMIGGLPIIPRGASIYSGTLEVDAESDE